MTVVHHSAICVRDMEESLRFWRDGLGFAVLMDQRFRGDWPTLLEGPTDSLRAVFLGDPAAADAGIVELVDLGTVPGPPDAAPPRSGFLLLSVFTDVTAALDRLAGWVWPGHRGRSRCRGWPWPPCGIPTGHWWSWWTRGPRPTSGGSPPDEAEADRGRPRRRCRGHRHGHPAPAGRLSVHPLRAVRRGGWDLAGQHLPGGGVRRPFPPLLVLVRAQPVVEPHLRHPAGDPVLSGAVRRPVRRPSPRADGHPDRRGPVGPTVAAVDPDRTVGGDVHRRGTGQRARHAERTPRARDPRRRAVRRSCLPLLPVGPLEVRGRGARGIHRNRGQRHPVRARHRPRGRAPHRVPADPDLDHPPVRRAVHTGAAATVRPRAPGRPPAPLADLADLPAGHCPGRLGADDDADRAGPLLPGPKGGGPRPAGGAHPRLSGGVQATADLPAVVPDPDPGQRTAGH